MIGGPVESNFRGIPHLRAAAVVLSQVAVEARHRVLGDDDRPSEPLLAIGAVGRPRLTALRWLVMEEIEGPAWMA